MSTRMYEEHVKSKIADFKEARLKNTANKRIMKIVENMQKEPEMPDFSQEDTIFNRYSKDRVGEHCNYLGVDPAFWTDPSKDAFYYKALEDTKDWPVEEMQIAQDMVFKALKDDKDDMTKIITKVLEPKIFVVTMIAMVLAKIWLSQVLFEGLESLLRAMMYVLVMGLMAKISIATTKMCQIAKTLLEEIAVLSNRFLTTQMSVMKIEMNLTYKGQNIQT